jgi:hypothetical protein
MLVTTYETKFHPRTGLEGPEEDQMYSYTLSLTSALDGGGSYKITLCRTSKT